MRNHEVTTSQMLLDEHGELREPGWSRSLVQKYRRSMIKAPKFRIKEWDYYIVVSRDFAAAFTISDDGYIGLQSVSLLVFGEEPWEHTETVLNAFPMGKLHLPEDSSRGKTQYSDKRLQMSFEPQFRRRSIRCRFENFRNGKPLEADIVHEQLRACRSTLSLRTATFAAARSAPRRAKSSKSSIRWRLKQALRCSAFTAAWAAD